MQTTPKVVLIDPHFNIEEIDSRSGVPIVRKSNGYIETTKALLRAAMKYRRVERFVFVVGKKDISISAAPDGSILLSKLKNIANEVDAAKINLELKFLDDSKITDDHARYLLGMSSGLHYDPGFNIPFKSSKTMKVEWLSDASLQPLLKLFT